MPARPLSPHLSVYRFQYTMALSIAHRVTGAILSVGLLPLAWWLMAVAGGRESYERAGALLAHPLSKVLLAGWVAAFAYHLCNGIRHLVWDTGRALEKPQARLGGALMVIAAVVLFLAIAALAFVFPRGRL